MSKRHPASLCRRFGFDDKPDKRNGLIGVASIGSDSECNTDVVMCPDFSLMNSTWQLDALGDAIGLLQRLYDEIMHAQYPSKDASA